MWIGVCWRSGGGIGVGKTVPLWVRHKSTCWCFTVGSCSQSGYRMRCVITVWRRPKAGSSVPLPFCPILSHGISILPPRWLLVRNFPVCIFLRVSKIDPFLRVSKDSLLPDWGLGQWLACESVDSEGLLASKTSWGDEAGGTITICKAFLPKMHNLDSSSLYFQYAEIRGMQKQFKWHYEAIIRQIENMECSIG